MSRVTKKLRNLSDPEKLMILPIVMIVFLACLATGMLVNESIVANETSMANGETLEACTEEITTEVSSELEEESETETTTEVETTTEEEQTTEAEETTPYVVPDDVYIEIIYPTYPESTTQEVTEVSVIDYAPFYNIQIDGTTYTMSHELQTYIYELCLRYDIEWFYPYFLCQLFQESRWQEGLVTEKGDYGIAQININIHQHLSEILGITDFANSYNSVTAGMYLMYEYISKGYTVRQAMTAYRWGEANAYNADPENYYDTVCYFTEHLFREN